MFPIKRYLVKEGDVFSVGNFPEVSGELTDLNREISYLPDNYKAEIVVSFLKDHMVKTDRMQANNALVGLLVSRSLQVSNIENLFESSRNNRPFLKDFEDYVFRLINEAADNKSG